MDIIISNASDKPIYEQIKEQIKVAIMSGELKNRRFTSFYSYASKRIKN